MKIVTLASLVASAALVSPAVAQQWSPEQTDAWQAIAASWDRNVDSGAWHSDMVANAYGWGGSAVVPVSRPDIQRASGIFGAEGKVLNHRLSPINISVHGDTALVHYFAEIVETDHKGERESNSERCSDTLVKDGGKWKFLGWGCADLSDD